jgi:HD superfamily phosphohydrolase
MELIDSPEVQRLRRIRQLGLASVAYPGAEHSRFTHSLGVMWTATRILDHLARTTEIPPQQALAVRCAALLHDVGHGPLSHVFEKFTMVHHEEWTRRMLLDPQGRLYRILASHRPSLPEEVVAIIEGRSHPLYLSQIISSQLDADRFDYLLRDSHMTGVKYGVFDLERLIRMLRLDAAGRQIVVARAGIHPVEGYLQSRFHMYAQVYLHKTVRAAEAVLGLTLKRAAELAAAHRLGEEERDPLGRILLAAGLRLFPSSTPAPQPSSGLNLQLDDYLDLDDHGVYGAMKRWRRHSDPILADLSARVLDRRFFKTVDVSRLKSLESRVKKARTIIAAAGGDPKYHLYVDESGDVPYRPYDRKLRRHGKVIFVEPLQLDGEYQDIAKVSEVVAGLARAGFITRRVMFPENLGSTDLRTPLIRLFTNQQTEDSFLPLHGENW